MSTTKHFINDPTHLVNSALCSISLLNPSLGLDAPNKVIYLRPTSSTASTSLLSGGGSGHEPSFSSLVGSGLLTAAVAGTIFASPSTAQIRSGIRRCLRTRNGGLCVVVMNYTGDVLNFGVAVEKARAEAGPDGQKVEMVVVGDDVGVGRTSGGKVGRRGIAGTVLVVKVAGAAAERGLGVEAVASVARMAAENLVSVGASLGRVHVPGRGADDEGEGGDNGADGKQGDGEMEVEIGMGIHNEPGSGRERLAGLPALVQRMLARLLDMGDKDRAFLTADSKEIVLLVNNLGGVSLLEMGGITAEVVTQLKDSWDIQPVRILSGTYMTSLNGPGFSISLLNVVSTNGIEGCPSMVELLDSPAEASGWAAPISAATWEQAKEQTSGDVGGDDHAGEQPVRPSGLKTDAHTFKAALETGLRRVIAAEPEVTQYDTIVGDGDCGIGMKRGAEAILKHLSGTDLTGDVTADVTGIVPVVEHSMDGTSGALYAIFLNALVTALRAQSPGDATPQVWAAAVQQSCDALSKYTPARPGDRTLVDALQPFAESLSKEGDIVKAARAAQSGAEGTKGMTASLGRAVYVGGSGFEKVPDPGAWGLACFFLGLAGIEA